MLFRSRSPALRPSTPRLRRSAQDDTKGWTKSKHLLTSTTSAPHPHTRGSLLGDPPLPQGASLDSVGAGNGRECSRRRGPYGSILALLMTTEHPEGEEDEFPEDHIFHEEEEERKRKSTADTDVFSIQDYQQLMRNQWIEDFDSVCIDAQLAYTEQDLKSVTSLKISDFFSLADRKIEKIGRAHV